MKTLTHALSIMLIGSLAACGGEIPAEGEQFGNTNSPATSADVYNIITRMRAGDVWELVEGSTGALSVDTSPAPAGGTTWHCKGNGMSFVTCTRDFIDGAGGGCARVVKHTNNTWCTTDC